MRKKYPLFFLRKSRKGVARTIQLERELHLTKSVKMNGEYFTSLTVPRYPSAAFDHMVARGGLNAGAAGTASKKCADHLILGITKQCQYSCAHCYEKHNINKGESVSVSRLKDVVADAQDLGTNIVIFSGGEPMQRYEDLLALLSSSDKNRSDFHIHTSGYGVTPERASELKSAGLTAAAVGLDDVNPGRHDRLRGKEGSFRDAVRALEYFSGAGVMTYVNICVTRELLDSGDIWSYYRLVKGLNVSMVQLLEPRPCGGYASLEMDRLFTERERAMLTDFFLRGNHEKQYRDYPLLYYVSYMESPERMGCMAGGLSHYYIDSAGNVNPCVFLPVTFGNILDEDLSIIFKRMRNAIPHPVRRQCPSILLADAIQKKSTLTGKMPVPYESIRGQWGEVFA